MQKTTELIEMLFGRLTPRNHVAQSPHRMNTFAAVRSDKIAMRPFAILLWSDNIIFNEFYAPVSLCSLLNRRIVVQ